MKLLVLESNQLSPEMLPQAGCGISLTSNKNGQLKLAQA
jgi:hypothetical protein